MHVITRLTMGGSSENTVLAIEALERAGYAVHARARARSPRRRSWRTPGGAAVASWRSQGLVREVQPARDLAAVGSSGGCFRRARPAIVHTHTSKAGFVGRLAAWLAGVPVVIHQPHGHIFYGYWEPADARPCSSGSSGSPRTGPTRS